MLETSHLERRFQVFVSSTFVDLEKERKRLNDALRDSNYIVEGMELFPAADVGQWQTIKRRLLESDVYVLIVADRYGSIADEAKEWEPELLGDRDAVSFTHMEYLYAKKHNIPVLAFIKKKRLKQPKDNEDLTVNEKRVDNFVNELKGGKITVKFWEDMTELVSGVLAAVNNKVQEAEFKGRKGWIRAESIKQPTYAENEAVYLQAKTHYVKLISYSDRRFAKDPLYSKTITRNSSVIDIWDEYVTVTVNQVSHLVDRFHYKFRTKGDGLDFTSLLPFVNKFRDADLGANKADTQLDLEILQPSDTFVHACSYYNGFQKGNMDFATKATKSTGLLRLIIDMTSIPGFAGLFKLLRCVRVNADEYQEDITDFSHQPQPGIFMIECTNVKRDTVVKFEFDLAT